MNTHRLTVILAAIAAVLGFAALGVTVFADTYAVSTATIGSDGTSSTTSGTVSMLQMGISTTTAIVLAGFAAGYLVVLFGALLIARADRRGRWLMAVGLAPLVAMNLISFGLVLLLPATAIAAVATVSGFTAGAARRAPAA